jgi:hypothetical protein
LAANGEKKAGIFTTRRANKHLYEQPAKAPSEAKAPKAPSEAKAQAKAPREAPQDAERNASKFNIPRKDVMPRDRLPSCRFKIYRGLLRIRMTTCLS